MNLLTINGSAFDVDITSIQRQASILDGPNAGRLEDASMNRDVIGTFYNYAFTVSQGKDPSDYDALFDLLTAPVKSHAIGVPFAQGITTFDAYVSDASDAMLSMVGGNQWGGLAFTAIAISPQRKAGTKQSTGSGSGSDILIVDNVGFNVDVTGLQRNGPVMDGQAATRSIDGVMSRDIIGTFYNYSLTIEPVAERMDEYDRLYYALTAPVDSHKVTLPYGRGTITFDAYISAATDELIRANEDGYVWGHLDIEFVAMAPKRRT